MSPILEVTPPTIDTTAAGDTFTVATTRFFAPPQNSTGPEAGGTIPGPE